MEKGTKMSQSGTYDTTTTLADVETITGDSGGAVGPDGAGNIDLVGSGPLTVDGTPASNLLTINWAAATDGQVLLAATGGDPAFATLTSTGGTITFTPGANSLNLEALNQTLTGDSGGAVSPDALGNIDFVGSGPLTVDGTPASNLMTINWAAATDGQVLVAATGLDPAFATLTSTGGTISFTPGANTLNLETNLAQIDTITGDSGGAVGPDGSSNIDFVGSGPLTVDGTPASNLLTINWAAATNGQVLIAATGGDPAFATLTSSGGTITFTPGANSLNLEAAVSAPSIKTTTFTSNDTWTKDADTAYLTVFVVNGGSGGGSGRRGASTAAAGGGGGAGGSGFSLTLPEDYFGATEAVVVGSGGAGGAAQTVDNTNGNNGSSGGVSSFAGMSMNPASISTNPFGGGGQSGFVDNRGGGPFGEFNLMDGVSTTRGTFLSQGGYGMTTAGTDADDSSIGGVNLIPTAGGGGGGADSVTERAGGAGGDTGLYYGSSTPAAVVTFSSGGAGGVESGTINGSNGTDGTTSNLNTYYNFGSGGGGGGGQSGGAAAGTGGDGGFPGGGGGGGGGSLNGTNSGAGGAGGDGVVIVVEYLYP